MNEFVRIAQVSTSSGAGPRQSVAGPSASLVLGKPDGEASTTVVRQSGQFVDFRAVLDEEISFFRVDGDLQMIFANGGSTVVEGFFEGAGGAQVAIVGDDRTLSANEFQSIASVATADEVQTAAGEAGSLSVALDGANGSGQTFQDTDIGALGDGLSIMDLLKPGEVVERPLLYDDPFSGDDGDDGENDTVPSVVRPADAGRLDEGHLPNGNEAGQGSLLAAGSLGIHFGENAGSSPTLTFDMSTDGVPLDASGEPLALTSDGVPLVYTLTTNEDGGQTLTATKGESDEVVFTVTLDIVPNAFDGGVSGANYQFTLSGNLDNIGDAIDAAIPVSFSVTAADTDGDTAGTDFTVTIADDDPVIGTSDAASVDEDGLAGGNVDSGYDGDLAGAATSATGSLGIAWGADDANPTSEGGTADRSVAFDTAQPGLEGLTSDGEAISITVLPDGMLVGYTGAAAPTGIDAAKVVFHATLSDAGSGSYTFTLVGNLDHASPDTEDDLGLTFSFTATDGDGDTAGSTFTVTVDDDAPVIGSPECATVDEGVRGETGDDDCYPGKDDGFADGASASGSLDIGWGADDANPTSGGGLGDRSVAFDDDQPGLEGLTSGGAEVSIVTLPDGTLVGYTGASVPTETGADGVVFFATLSDEGSGSYTFTLVDALDKPDGDKESGPELTISFTATDGDGDTAGSTFKISVDDDVPVIGKPDVSCVDEEGLAGGNVDSGYRGDLRGAAVTADGDLAIDWGADDANPTDGGGAGDRSVAFDASQPGLEGLTSDGAEVSVTVLADGTLVGYTGGSAPEDAGADCVVFFAELSDTGSGSYTFTLVDNLDHPQANKEDDLDLTFSFTATDSEGDTACATFTVKVDDDALVIGCPQDACVDEEGLAGGNVDSGYRGDLAGAAITAGGALAIAWGVDDANATSGGGLGDRSVAFNDDQPGLDCLTSDGEPVSIAVLADGTLVGYTGGSAPTETGADCIVFFAELSDEGSGSYTFTLVDNLDHPRANKEDDLDLTFSFTATDGDGDTACSTFTVTVDDDAPVIGDPEDTTVDVDAPGGDACHDDRGRAEYAGSDGATSSGSLAIAWGVDDGNPTSGGGLGDRSVAFDECQPGLECLTSDGDAIRVTILADGTLVGYAGESAPTETDADGVVFFAELSDEGSGSYTFTLVGNLDQPQGGKDEDVDLNFSFIATDGDGDTACSTFTVSVGVDDPLVIGRPDSSCVDEEGLAGGNVDSGYRGDLRGAAVTADGDLAIDWGSDDANPTDGGGTGDRSVAFDATQPGLEGLTSDGAEVSVTVLADGTLVGYTGGSAPEDAGADCVVFFAELSDKGSGSYTFTLLDNLDHPQANKEDDLDLTFSFTATDSDGDTACATFTVKVDDDAPVIGCPQDACVDEEGLAGGNVDSGYRGDLAGAAITAGGALAIAWGVDDANATSGGGLGDRSVAFNDDQPGLDCLTSDGEPVSIAVFADGTLVGYTGGSAPTETGADCVVFFAELSDEGSGSYTFTLVDNLDHPRANREDDLDLTFSFTATDGDGDTACSTFTVTVDDDAPVIGCPQDACVDEDDIPGSGSECRFVAEPDTGATAAGSLDISWGVDDGNPTAGGGLGDRSVEFDDCQPALECLTSDGDRIRVTVLSDGTLVGYTGRAEPCDVDAKGVVFYASLSDEGSGSYAFTLVEELDHPRDCRDDELDLTFSFIATDGDGDTARDAFTVTVKDADSRHDGGGHHWDKGHGFDDGCRDDGCRDTDDGHHGGKKSHGGDHGQEQKVAAFALFDPCEENRIAAGLESTALKGSDDGDRYLPASLSGSSGLISGFGLLSDSDAEGELLDIGRLLDDAFGNGPGEVSPGEAGDYIRILQADGDGARVEVDPDGAEGGASWTKAADLQNVSLGDTVRVVLDEDGTTADVVVA